MKSPKSCAVLALLAVLLPALPLLAADKSPAKNTVSADDLFAATTVFRLQIDPRWNP